ncbi:hypothetical protein KFL_003830160 [Klebsormidium nitens]|uniref:F-box domain-containing protein n=1 Tax=Klebsormidium nitens TaxID=105231 RepID=A0A1Y1IGM7_KLENI|nr:hypothetical protein KFL_003830160 [Klebsormidium nitens]|eukprot:GAQ87867.1 hypothetical protein KFL_003830160 [Klebsormidium nitens]
MERLPSELLVCVILRLAAQDPPSLARAAFACKSLLRLVKDNKHIWKAAFLAPEGGEALSFEQDEQNAIGLLEAELDAEVASLGGRPGRVLSIEGKPWTLLLDASLCTDVGYEPPGCGGRAFVISQEPRTKTAECDLQKSTFVVVSEQISEALAWATPTVALTISLLVGVAWIASKYKKSKVFSF